MLFNANGLELRIEDIKRFAYEKQIDLSFIVETHYFENQYPSIPELIHNSPAYEGPDGGKIGGISILTHSTYVQRMQIKILETSRYWIILDLYGDIITICYLPPSLELAPIMKDMLDLLQNLSDNWSKSVTIVGDFNARHMDLGDHINNTRGITFCELLTEFPLQRCQPVIGKWTTIVPNPIRDTPGKGVTDHILYNQQRPKNFVIFESESLGGSDHRPLVWDFDPLNINNIANPKGQRNAKWNWDQFRKNPNLILEYQQTLLETQPVIQTLDFFNGNLDNMIDTEWKTITDWIKEALHKTCGKKQPVRFNNKLFWTPELKRQSKLIDNASNNCSLLPERKVIHKRYAKNLKKRQEETKRLFWDELCQSSNQPQFYRKITNQNKEYVTSGLSETCMNDYVNHFGTTFGSYPTGDESLASTEILEATEPNGNWRYESYHQILESEITDIINWMGKNKSPGDDDLPVEAYQYGGNSIVIVLQQFFNLLLSTQKVPTQWNTSLVCLIYKKKGCNKDIANYRPISLTIVAKRIFEKIIDTFLDPYKSQLHKLQGGFRKGRSTMHQIYYLSELMQSHKLINVFLDLKAAYDTVDRNILWTLLANRYGIPYHLIRMMRALFDNNKSYLLVENTRSEPIANHRGVPQGSSIAPTMFNFFINGLIEILEAMPRRENVPSNCLFFADDGNLHSTSSEHVQNLLDVCHEWSTQHGMTFAAQKCLVLARNPTQLTLGSTQLPQVECATYLGIPFKPNGPDWNQAAKKMSQKAQAIVMLLAKKGFNKNTWCPAVKIRVYKLFIRPLMEYGMQCTLYN